MEIPKEIQADIVNYQALQNQLAILQNQLVQIDAQIRSVSEAISALESTEDEYAYKVAGPVLVREKKSVLLAEMKDRKEALEIKKKSVEKKIEQIQQRLKELKEKIEKALQSMQVGGNAPAPQGG